MANPIRRNFYSHETQRLVNGLPSWHAGRQRRDSNYHKLMNAAYGMTLDRYNESFSDFIDNAFLATSRLNETDIISVAPIPARASGSKPIVQYNRLLNSNFYFDTSVISPADCWSFNGLSQIVSDGNFGPNSISLIPELGVETNVWQSVNVESPAGNAQGFSAYMKVDSFDTSGMTLPTSNYGIKIVYNYEDGTTDTFQRTLPVFHTGGEWSRLHIAGSPSKHLKRVDCYLAVEATASFNIPVNVQFDGAMLEDGPSLRKYQPNIFDKIPFFQGISEPINYFFVDADRPVYRLLDDVDFWSKAIPTASSLVGTRPVTGVQDDIARGGVVVDFFKDEFPTEYKLDRSAKTLVWKNSITQSNEIYQTFTLEVRDESCDYVPYTPLTTEGIASSNTWLHLVSNAVNTAGRVMKVLHIIDQRVPTPYPSTLQVMNTIELPILESEQVISAEFRFDDQQHIYISTDTTEYVVRLYYDYYMLDTVNGEILFRELYEEFVAY